MSQSWRVYQGHWCMLAVPLPAALAAALPVPLFGFSFHAPHFVRLQYPDFSS